MKETRGPLAALRKLRRFRLAAGGLCGVAVGLLVDSSSLQIDLVDWWQGREPRATSISVSGHARLTANDVASATGVAKGSLLADIDPRAVEQRLASHPWIRAARAAVLPSGALLVKIEEREPRAVVRSDADPQWWLVDDWGVPFAPAAPELAATLPRLFSSSDLAGDYGHAVLARAVSIVGALLRGALREVAPSEGATAGDDAVDWPEGLELHLPAPHSHQGWVLHSAHPRVEVILGVEDIEPRLQRLERLLGSDLREVRRAESIDLRFADRAVLRAASVSR